MKWNKKGTIALYLTFIILATIIVLVGAVVAPLGATMNSEFYAAGDMILSKSNDSISRIQDPAVAAAIANDFSTARAATLTNIEVSTDLYKYSWAFLLVITGLVLFLQSRKMVEYAGNGGFI